jgi:8-oxo-dGTP pyrophosphatase MutT (NUDIX family)
MVVWEWVVAAACMPAGNHCCPCSEFSPASAGLFCGIILSMAWKKLSSREVYRNRFMWVTDEELVTDHGDKIKFGVVHKVPGASIVPWDGTHFTLVGQYRYPVDTFSWEFPAGHYEHDSMEEAAREELREEAGLLAGKIEAIGEYHLAPGHHTQVIHFYLATNLKESQQELETAEKGMQVKKFTHRELNHMIKSGEIKDSLTIAALKFFELSQSQSR